MKDEKRLLWLPPEHQETESAVAGSTVAIALFFGTCTGDEVFFRQMQVNTPLVISTSEAALAIEIVDKFIEWASAKLYPSEYRPTAETAAVNAAAPALRYGHHHPQAIYQRYIAARKAWYNAQPRGGSRPISNIGKQ